MHQISENTTTGFTAVVVFFMPTVTQRNDALGVKKGGLQPHGSASPETVRFLQAAYLAAYLMGGLFFSPVSCKIEAETKKGWET